tara:strand:- start:5374 stop:5589 length:216 start_codon:yes stop_codon:yes gene_type:complete
MSQNNQKPTVFQVLLSVLAGMFGVQNSKNRERDFKHGSPLVFILIGVLLTGGFVVGVLLLVKFAMSLAGVR